MRGNDPLLLKKNLAAVKAGEWGFAEAAAIIAFYNDAKDFAGLRGFSRSLLAREDLQKLDGHEDFVAYMGIVADSYLSDTAALLSDGESFLKKYPASDMFEAVKLLMEGAITPARLPGVAVSPPVAAGPGPCGQPHVTERLLSRAEAFARRAHGAQRYGAYPYAKHLEDTVRILGRFLNQDTALFCAAWLHDCIEDTQTGADALRAEFGERIAGLVLAVTRRATALGKEELGEYYARIKATPGAVTLKLADRIANVEACLNGTNAGQLLKYRQLHPRFCTALQGSGNEALWEHLLLVIRRDSPLFLRQESFACVVCGTTAATVTLVPAGSPMLGSIVSPGFLIEGFMGSALSGGLKSVDAALAALKGRDLEALRKICWEAGCFECHVCRRVYCLRHWNTRVEFDDGFYDCTRGTCPDGHTQLLDD
ncbi:MAG: HD domain-containing protein [Elusimicrobiota bacterium]|nr:HD domain-containing protein [Elusimicrobiota bacterium]